MEKESDLLVYLLLPFISSEEFCSTTFAVIFPETYSLACKPFSTFTSNRCFANFENEISNVFFVMSNLDLGKHVDSNSILVSESHLNGKGKGIKH